LFANNQFDAEIAPLDPGNRFGMWSKKSVFDRFVPENPIVDPGHVPKNGRFWDPAAHSGGHQTAFQWFGGGLGPNLVRKRPV
jgi:hypothetical protein